MFKYMLYWKVTQNTMRKCEGKQLFLENIFKFMTTVGQYQYLNPNSIITGIYVLLKQCYYCANTGTFSKFCVAWCDLPPPPILLGLMAAWIGSIYGPTSNGAIEPIRDTLNCETPQVKFEYSFFNAKG